ncbi:inner nuclear membrane protein enriched at telomere/subtelomere region, partial [Coemansia sp. RSA 2603]
MEADDSKYLEAGFDASVLKVSRLRSILVKHNVEFPSNAKKPELVAIFERKVAARAGKLRKEAGRARQAKGDGRSIEVVQEAPAGNVSSGVSNVSGGGKRKLSDVVDQQEEPRRRKKKSGKRRVPVTGSDADEPSALNEPEPRRKKKKVEAVAAVLLGSPRESGNFSDDNPFQAKARAKAELGASPEQRRTPRKTPKEPATTPLAALRKSQQSDVAFRVALPGARSGASESGSADGESAKDGDSKDASKDGDSKDEPEDVEMLEPSTEVETKPVQEIKKQPQQPQQPLFPAQAQAAKTEKPVQHSQQPVQPQPVQQQPVHAQKQTQQQQPIKKERHPELPPPPRFDLSRAPNEPVVSASRLTLTPEALRQMAAERRQQQPQPQQPQQPQSQQHAAKPPPMPGLAADDVHVLQRRRVATLRQHVEAEDRSTTSSAAAAAHSRRSSIASIADVVGEARGVPCEPAAAVIDSSSASAPVVPTTRRAKRPSAARRLALLVLLGLAGVGWRTHEQLQLGFRNTRAGEPAMVPPADSALTEPSRPAGEIAS